MLAWIRWDPSIRACIRHRPRPPWRSTSSGGDHARRAFAVHASQACAAPTPARCPFPLLRSARGREGVDLGAPNRSSVRTATRGKLVGDAARRGAARRRRSRGGQPARSRRGKVARSAAACTIGGRCAPGDVGGGAAREFGGACPTGGRRRLGTAADRMARIELESTASVGGAGDQRHGEARKLGAGGGDLRSRRRGGRQRRVRPVGGGACGRRPEMWRRAPRPVDGPRLSGRERYKR